MREDYSIVFGQDNIWLARQVRRTQGKAEPFARRTSRTLFSRLVLADRTLRILLRVTASVERNTRRLGAKMVFTREEFCIGAGRRRPAFQPS